MFTLNSFATVISLVVVLSSLSAPVSARPNYGTVNCRDQRQAGDCEDVSSVKTLNEPRQAKSNFSITTDQRDEIIASLRTNIFEFAILAGEYCRENPKDDDCQPVKVTINYNQAKTELDRAVLTRLLDDSNYIAFIHAAKVCLETDARGKLVHASPNCEAVRETVALSSLQIFADLKNTSLAEISSRISKDSHQYQELLNFLKIDFVFDNGQGQEIIFLVALKRAQTALTHSLKELEKLERSAVRLKESLDLMKVLPADTLLHLISSPLKHDPKTGVFCYEKKFEGKQICF